MQNIETIRSKSTHTYIGIPNQAEYENTINTYMWQTWTSIGEYFDLPDKYIQYAISQRIFIIPPQKAGLSSGLIAASYYPGFAIVISVDEEGNTSLSSFIHELNHLLDLADRVDNDQTYFTPDGTVSNQKYQALLQTSLHWLQKYYNNELQNEDEIRLTEFLNFLVYGTKLNGDNYFNDPILNKLFAENIELFSYHGIFPNISDLVNREDAIILGIHIQPQGYEAIGEFVAPLGTLFDILCINIPPEFRQFFPRSSFEWQN